MTNIAKLLVAARRAVTGRVFKAGKNAAMRYRYVGHEQVVEHVRAAMLDQGLALVQDRVEFAGQAGKGLLWLGSHTLHHESGETLGPIVVLATTQDNDKAAYVASTALDRTALLRVMGLAGTEEEDPEHDSHDTPEHTPRDQPARKTPRDEVREHFRRLGLSADDVKLVTKFMAGTDNSREIDDATMLLMRDSLAKYADKATLVAAAQREVKS